MSRRFVVCAACRHEGTGLIIPGPRHFDETMRKLIEAIWHPSLTGKWPHDFEQGFIDQRGQFLTREEAMDIAKAAGQPIDIEMGCGGSETVLYSEGLY